MIGEHRAIQCRLNILAEEEVAVKKEVP